MNNQPRPRDIFKLYQAIGFLQGVLKGVEESDGITSDVQEAIISALEKSEEMIK